MKIYRGQTPQYLALSEILAKRAHPRAPDIVEFVLGRFSHFHTLQLSIQTQNSVAPELQVFISSLEISAKRAHP